jgi:CheY-like chemotaxis protein
MKRILLLVEDDAITAHLYKAALERVGFEVQVSRDGQAALETLADKSPDAVLLDVMMPHLNGIEVLKRIRADEKLQKVPVLIYTNAFVPKLIEDAKAAGATNVVEKATLTPNTLLKILDTAMQEHGHPPLNSDVPRAA